MQQRSEETRARIIESALKLLSALLMNNLLK